MKIGKTIYVYERKAWRRWLAKNHGKEKEIWLLYYKKSSGRPRIPYNDAVEEALCYGWIDSIVKKVDDLRFAQRFTPRRSGSNLSQPNIERIHKLVEEDKMTNYGLAAVGKLYDRSSKDKKVVIARDILAALKKDKVVWDNFSSFPEHYKKIRIAYIESYRERGKEEFMKRLQNFINNTAKNRKIGFIR